ncbi:hypothetical protein B0T20DRAFT_72221 [Sordaria brevicollis]|uniref:Uncharacterized protein n=1 Tax=Sordaria brevicollis TaxID=83679 RepID=A0AAE0P2D4_SORBR|nr:hypothetical protein B0T20DRAFT_72221 [Sordaria brevicollis]
MAALPENWEMDYDGAISRWIYRFKPTGLIQYTFPKPGDEFPEFVGDFGGPMPPEDRFLSQKLKKGGAGSETVPSSPPFNIRTAASSANFSGPSYKDPPPWCQPDEFMYMSPGAYNDTGPEQDEDEAGLPATDPKTPESKATKPSTRPFVSPLPSTEATPLVVNTRPTVVTPPEQHTPARIKSAPAASDTILSPGVPMLDGRPVNQVFPIGFVAELYGDSTGRPPQKNPTASELPGHEAPIRKLQMENSGQDGPVELSSESASVKANSGSKAQSDQKPESSPFILGANFASPPSSKPRPSHNHRHSIQGPVPSQVEVPAASPSKEGTGQVVSDDPSDKAEPVIDNGNNLQPNGLPDRFGAQRVPSILQPARGRPKPVKSASDGQQASTKTRLVRKPLYDLPELDQQTVKPLHGHQSMILLKNPDEMEAPPAFTRTNTLPADLPSLPFMGNGFSAKTGMSSPVPRTQDPQPPPSPTRPSEEEEPQMGSRFASTSRPHRGSLSDYANPVLPEIGQPLQPLNISRKPSLTDVQGVDGATLAVQDDVEQRASRLAEELSQAITEFSFYPGREPRRDTEQLARDSLVPGDGSHDASQFGDPGSAPPRPDKIPLDNPRSVYNPYRPPLGESPAFFRRKPVAGFQGPHEMSTPSNMGVEQQGDPVPPLDHFPQQEASGHHALAPSYGQQTSPQRVEALLQPDMGSYPQDFSVEQQFVSPQSQARASTWPKQEPTPISQVQNDDLASKPLPPAPQGMARSRGLQSESWAPAVKEKRGLLSKFRRTGNTASSSNKLQKSIGNGLPSQPPVTYPPQQIPPQYTQVQGPAQGPSSHPDQTQAHGFQWPANTLDAWSAYGHDPRAFTPTIQLGGPQHEPQYVYQSYDATTPQQPFQYFQHQQQVDNRRESQVSNLTSNSSPSPDLSNADAVSIADSSRVSIISSHHTRPGSDGAASLASVSTVGRNSEITPPRPNSNRLNNGPGPSRWGSVSGYDGSGWGDVE